MPVGENGRERFREPKSIHTICCLLTLTKSKQQRMDEYHLDVGWKPSDMTQRNGRIIRQGNMNKEVKVFNYVTEGTFDSYLFVRHEVA